MQHFIQQVTQDLDAEQSLLAESQLRSSLSENADYTAATDQLAKINSVHLKHDK